MKNNIKRISGGYSIAITIRAFALELFYCFSDTLRHLFCWLNSIQLWGNVAGVFNPWDMVINES